MITQKQLEEFGFLFKGNGSIWATKTIAQNEDDKIEFIVTVEHNMPEVAISTPDGGIIFLGGIESIDDLKIIEKSITRYEPNY